MLVTEALDVIAGRLPVPVLGIDSDSGSAFISQALIDYCREKGIEFTRSRAYRSNDQAHIEQKNGAAIRRFAGQIAGQALAQLFALVGLCTNFFQPSFRLLARERDGSRVAKRYDRPRTPCQRMLEHPAVSSRVREELQSTALPSPGSLGCRGRPVRRYAKATEPPRNRSRREGAIKRQELKEPVH